MLLSCTTLKYKTPEIDPLLFEPCLQQPIIINPSLAEQCDAGDVLACKALVISLIQHSFELNKEIIKCHNRKQEIKTILESLEE